MPFGLAPHGKVTTQLFRVTSASFFDTGLMAASQKTGWLFPKWPERIRPADVHKRNFKNLKNFLFAKHRLLFLLETSHSPKQRTQPQTRTQTIEKHCCRKWQQIHCDKETSLTQLMCLCKWVEVSLCGFPIKKRLRRQKTGKPAASNWWVSNPQPPWCRSAEILQADVSQINVFLLVYIINVELSMTEDGIKQTLLHPACLVPLQRKWQGNASRIHSCFVLTLWCSAFRIHERKQHGYPSDKGAYQRRSRTRE